MKHIPDPSDVWYPRWWLDMRNIIDQPSVLSPCVIVVIPATIPIHWSYFHPPCPPSPSNYQPNKMYRNVQCRRYNAQQPVQHQNSRHPNRVPFSKTVKTLPANWEHRSLAKWYSGIGSLHVISMIRCRSNEMFASKSLYNSHILNTRPIAWHRSMSLYALVQFDLANIDGISLVAFQSLYLTLESRRNYIPRPLAKSGRPTHNK